MNELENLRNLVLAPYIMAATALIGISRKVGGNQFRHSFATLGILLDYHYTHAPVLLKAALLHDLFEELPKTELDEIRKIDSDGPQVVELVLEVTRSENETKEEYLERLLKHGSHKAKVLKCADRISNLTDLHRDSHENAKILDYLDQTEKYILPLAREVNPDMLIELTDLVSRRRKIVLNAGL